jgi:hypothetical protein
MTTATAVKTKKAVVRISGAIEKSFNEAHDAVWYARFLVANGTKRENIKVCWEFVTPPQKALTNELNVSQDFDGRDIYVALPKVFADYYAQIELTNIDTGNIWFKEYDLRTNDRIGFESLRTATELNPADGRSGSSHRTIMSQAKWDTYELVGKMLANI